MWSFTHAEQAALRAARDALADGGWPPAEAGQAAIGDAYRALTRLGNATADPHAGGDRTDDGWDGVLDRPHHDLGLALGMLHRPPPPRADLSWRYVLDRGVRHLDAVLAALQP